MRPDPHLYDKTTNKQDFFNKTNEETLIMHRRMKEIESINRFKEEYLYCYSETRISSFKNSSMKFCKDTPCKTLKWGVQSNISLICRFLVYYFEKEKSTPEKIFLKPYLKIISSEREIS